MVPTCNVVNNYLIISILFSLFLAQMCKYLSNVERFFLVFCFCVGLGIGGDNSEARLVHYNEDNQELISQ